MENMLRTMRIASRLERVCKQCRHASTQTGVRYSAQTATRGLANDTQRPFDRELPHRGSDSAAISRELSRCGAEPTTTRTTPPTSNQPWGRTSSILDILKPRNTVPNEQNEAVVTGRELESEMQRKFVVGDIYSPHDLSDVEQMKWGRVQIQPRSKLDIIDHTGLDHLREYKNIGLMQEFVTSNGRLLPGKRTGLRPVHHRRMAKAVRRAAGIGLIPKTYKHPELQRRTPS